MKLQLYMHIVEDIKDKINNGTMKADEKLPTELELAEIYDVSKSTVRKSVSMLSEQGYIYSVPRIGNFVSLPKTDEYMMSYDEPKIGILEIDEVRILKSRKISSKDMPKEYQLPSMQSQVLEVSSLLLSTGFPIAYEVKYIFFSKGLTIQEEELVGKSFLEILSEKISLYHINKSIKIRGCKPTETLAQLLFVREHEPLLRVDHFYWDEYDKIIAIAATYYRGDFITLNAESF